MTHVVRKGLRVTYRDCLADQKIISLPLALESLTYLARAQWHPVSALQSLKYLHSDLFNLIYNIVWCTHNSLNLLAMRWPTNRLHKCGNAVGAARELIIYLWSTSNRVRALFVAVSLNLNRFFCDCVQKQSGLSTTGFELLHGREIIYSRAPGTLTTLITH